MKKNKLFWILTVVCVLNFAAHLYFYPSLPDIVRLGAEILGVDFGRAAVCDVDFV